MGPSLTGCHYQSRLRMKTYKNIDAVRYLNDKGATCTTSGKNVKNGEVNTSCPYCNDKSNHLRIKPNNFIECWRCGDHGHFANLIKILDNCSYKEALKIQKEYETDQILIQQPKEIVQRDINSFKFPFGFKSPIHKQHRIYLEERGFDPDETQLKYQLRSVLAENKKYQYRLIIPIIINNKIVNFTGRTILKDVEPRYKDAEDEWVIHKTQCLYNIDSVKEGGIAIGVEGAFDSISGGDGVVGFLSTNFSIQQIELLKSKKLKKFFICFDNTQFDPNAQKKADELASYFPFTDVEFIDLPDGIKDFGELSRSDIRHIRSIVF